MKITYNSLINSVSNSVQTNLKKLQDLQQKLSSGKKINSPSDDPVQTANLNILKTKENQYEQYIETIDKTESWLEFNENAIDQINSSVKQIRDICIQAGNGALNQDGRNTLILNLDQLKQNITTYANSKYLDNYIFAGLKTTQKPFIDNPSIDGGIEYIGDDGIMSREISFESQIDININGKKLFNIDNEVSADPNLFELIDNLKQALRDGNIEEISGNILNQVDRSCTNIQNIYSEIGSKVNRLEMTKAQHENNLLSIKKTVSASEDIDIADVVMELKKAEMVYSTSLNVAGRIFPPSLLDYLK